MSVMLPRVFTPPLRDLSEPDASWGHDLIWFCKTILKEPLSDWQEWLAIHALEVLPKEKAIEFAMLEENPEHELAKIERLYAPSKANVKRPLPVGILRFSKILILISRQNGKTDFVKKLIKWGLFRKRMPEVLATAQTLNKAMELWEEIRREVADSTRLAKLVEKTILRNGAQQLLTKQGCSYRPSGIDENAGRGDTVNLLYIDELRTQKNFVGISSLEPTVTAADNGLIIVTSNAGAEHSVVLREYREKATLPILNGTADNTRFGLFEWSADPAADIDDEQAWRQANPDLGNGRITIAKMRGFRESLPEATFRTEHLCQWVAELAEDITPIFPVDMWKRREVSIPVRVGYKCLAIEMSPVTGRTKFVVAGKTTAGYHLEVAPYGEQLTVDEIVSEVKRFIDINDPVAVIFDDKTDLVSLVEPLKRAGVEPTIIGYQNLSKAYKLTQTLFDDGKITNDGNSAWEYELNSTWTRVVNNGRDVLIDRFKNEPQCLSAAMLAVWGLQVFAPVAPTVAPQSTRTVIHGAQTEIVSGHEPAWAGSSGGRRPGKWR